MRVELPESFEKRMQEMLGDEYESYIESYDNPRQYGLRINPMKITEEELAEGSGFSLDPIPCRRCICIIAGIRNRCPGNTRN